MIHQKKKKKKKKFNNLICNSVETQSIQSDRPTLSAKCWMMKARLDMRGFSNREQVFRWVLYSF